MAWRTLGATELEREYSPSSCIGGDYRPFIDAYVSRSVLARARVGAGMSQLDLRYGPGERCRLDLFLPRPPGAARPPPLLVFIHGGYWQELSKDESSFAATGCIDAGIALAALGYTLAPAASVAHIVQECREALAWLRVQAGALGFDATRIAVAGSSAGAHLAAMCAWPQEGHASPVQAAVLVSGLYELEPLVGTSLNAALGLDVNAARALSPLLMPGAAGFPPCIVAWGEVETAEFKRQSREFADSLRRSGTRCQVLEAPQRNHFDVILDLADPATALGAATLALMRSL